MINRLKSIPQHTLARLVQLALLPHAVGVGLLLLMHQFGPDLGQSLAVGLVFIGICAMISVFLLVMLELHLNNRSDNK